MAHLDGIRQPPHEYVTPASWAVDGEEGPADAGVHGDKALVLLPQVVLGQHFTVGAQVIAGIRAVHDAHVGQVLRDQVRRSGIAVEDEDEVGRAVQALGNEELEIGPRIWALGIRIQDERSIIIGGVSPGRQRRCFGSRRLS